jgi:hypothetical protein
MLNQPKSRGSSALATLPFRSESAEVRVCDSDGLNEHLREWQLMEWSGRAPYLPASDAGRGYQGALPCPTNQLRPLPRWVAYNPRTARQQGRLLGQLAPACPFAGGHIQANRT